MYYATKDQIDRLKLGIATKSYKHLESWHELYLFQRLSISNTHRLDQIKEISRLATEQLQNHTIRLPIDDKPMRRALIKKMIRVLKPFLSRKWSTSRALGA